jgi:DNA-directed RNA polymerase subunit RPC12/RpoP
VLLDRRGRLIDAPLVYQGGQSETAIRLADCFRDAIRTSAAAIVLVHNHPSADPSASPDDVRLTCEAGQAGLLLGIDVLDHVILTRDGFVSLRAEHLYVPPVTDAASALRTTDMVLAPGWGYDCARCGARVRGLGSRTITCQRCLAPVMSRMLQSARELPAPQLSRPAAA